MLKTFLTYHHKLERIGSQNNDEQTKIGIGCEVIDIVEAFRQLDQFMIAIINLINFLFNSAFEIIKIQSFNSLLQHFELSFQALSYRNE